MVEPVPLVVDVDAIAPSHLDLCDAATPMAWTVAGEGAVHVGGGEHVTTSDEAVHRGSVLPSISDICCEVPELRGDNFKIWKENILFQLGCMDIDYAIRKDEPHKITDTSTPNEILLHERWEKPNRLSVMYIKTKISAGIRGSIEQHENVRELLKAIDEQFVTSDKALANTLIMKFTSLKLIDIRGVREHIMKMRDIVAQLKKLKVEMSESFLVHFILNTLLPQYGPFKISYNTHKDKWSINELMIMCVQEEGRLLMEQGESVMLVTQKKGKSQASQKGKQQIPPKSDIKKDEKWYAKPKEASDKYLEDGQSLGPFTKFLQEHGIVTQYTMLGSLDQNGVAERRNRTLLDMGCSSEVRIYNPQEKKLDPRTISGYFIGYAEKSKGYRFYYPSHNTRIVESRNAKFFEYDLVSESNQFRNIVYDIDHTESQPSTSSDRLFIVHNTPRVQSGVERTIVEVQPIIEVPQAVDNILVDQVDQELPDTSEQQVEPHTSLEDIGATLRRSTRIKRSTIPNDYVVYLQKCDYNIRAENDPESFSQAMSCKESKLWYNAMKDEMSSMK
ncbi:hypothetical protein CK203_017300 [Vitis vinifera]|uniref:Retroviral polymerase SH3-like domain-containing protein n=1 Tax=Vitis vinifera TaxID=29760 RepID=A0A438JZP9_VITVI|nr:hypothetical protein CK203_017300 [Vitis vinifera]